MLSSDGELVAGCQLFVRDLPLIGGVACVPRGPLLSARAPDLLDQLLAAMRRFAREEGIFCISLEPPVGCHELPAQLQTRGLTRSALRTVPCAGVQVNLSGHPDEARVFGALPSETRRRVCEAQAHGVVVRVTRERDLHLLSTLLAASAAPEARPTQPNDYSRLLWRAFSGQAQLQVAEHEGRPLSASLLIRFGDTVSCVAATWGAARDGPPGAEELMHWTAIRRAHAGGFRHYDLGALPIEVVRSALSGTERSPDRRGAWSKLAFGGDVVSYPDAYDMVLGPVVGPLLGRAALAHRLPPVANRPSAGGGRPPPAEPSLSRRYKARLKPGIVKLRAVATRTLERRAQITTTGVIAPEELGFSAERGLGYEPSPWMTLNRILKRSEVEPTDVFVDFGSGMGRVLCQAATRYPFLRVEGVELSPALSALARENLERNRYRFRCQDIRLVTSDALDYDIPDDLTIAYLFNPFHGRSSNPWWTGSSSPWRGVHAACASSM